MSDPASTQPRAAPARRERDKESWGSFLWFCVKLAIAALLFRSFVFTSFNIPSESMMPRLEVGDYLFAAKWPYGYSRFSLPFDAPLIPGRLFASLPERGDVVIFKHPIDHVDYIKRVIGLPGDRVQVVGGVVHLNGEPLGLERVEDFVLPIGPGESCGYRLAQFTVRLADGSFECRFPQFRETLPGGKSYAILDTGVTVGDDTAQFVVPPGNLFVMGDNRDHSADSRFPAQADGAVGFLPQENLVGRASFMYFSTDGTAEWLKPWTWFSAARWDRIGRGI